MEKSADDGSVRVIVRVRPLIGREKVDRCGECISTVDEEAQVVVGKGRSFTYDSVYGKYAQQYDVWNSIIPLVNYAFEGYNATVFAYGQTGSGKTYTMGSGSNLHVLEEEQGVIPRVIMTMFERVYEEASKKSGYKAEFSLRFIEIYGEEIRDLIDPFTTDGKVSIRETETGEVLVSGATEINVVSAEECMQLLERGTLCRTTGSTLMNAHSSRSHAIFTLKLTQYLPMVVSEDNSSSSPKEKTLEEDGKENCEIRSCFFNFVDLAGSERQKRTQAEGKRLKEGIEINKGLLALGNVISALGDEKKRGRVHVPYRDSKLTRMLQDSLGGNSRTLMITCVSPADVNFEETLNALKYANRARNIKNKAVINRDPGSSVVVELQRQVQLLQAELVRLKGGDPTDGKKIMQQLETQFMGNSSELEELRQRNELAESEVVRLIEELKITKTQMSFIKESAIVAQAEKDYYKILCEENNIQEDKQEEKTEKLKVLNEHLLKISELEEKLAKANQFIESVDNHENQDDISHCVSMEDVDDFSSVSTNAIVTEDELKDAYSDAKEDDEDELQAQRIYKERQLNLSGAVKNLSTTITMKEQLVSQLKQSQLKFDKLKEFYEEKILQMNNQVKSTTQDRDKLLTELQSLETQEKPSKFQENILTQLKQKDKELAELKKKQKEYKNYLKLKMKQDQQIRQLQNEISTMKKQKIDILKKLEFEKKQSMKQASFQKKEIMALKKTTMEKTYLLKKMGTLKEAQDRVMKRRLDEVTAQNKRLKQRQVSTFMPTIEEKKNKVWIAQQVKTLAEKQKKTEELEREVLKREKIVQRMEKLYGMRDKLHEEFSTATTTSIRDVVISPYKDKKDKLCFNRRSLNVEEEATLYELEDRIEACQAQLEYKEDRISEIANDVERNEPNSGDFALDKIQNATLPQARTLLKIMFETAVSAKKNEQIKEDLVNKYKIMMEEARRNQNDAELSLQQLKMNYDQQLTQLQRDHEEKLAFYLNLVNPPEDVTSKDKLITSKVEEISPAGRDTMLLSMAEERVNILRQQCQQLENTQNQLEANLKKAEEENICDKKTIQEYHSHCKWLEMELGKKFVSPNESSYTRNPQTQTLPPPPPVSIKNTTSVSHLPPPPTNLKNTSLGTSTKSVANTTTNSHINDKFKHTKEDISKEHLLDSNDEEYEDVSGIASIGGSDIFHRLANPSNFTGIHKQRMQESVKKKEELKSRGDRLRARRLKDRQIGGDHISSIRQSLTRPSNSDRQISKSSSRNLIDALEDAQEVCLYSEDEYNEVAAVDQEPETLHEDNNFESSGNSQVDVYTRLAGQYTASSKSKRSKAVQGLPIKKLPNEKQTRVSTGSIESNTSSQNIIYEDGELSEWVGNMSIDEPKNELLRPHVDTTEEEYGKKDPLLGVDRLVVKVHDDYNEKIGKVEKEKLEVNLN